MALHTLWEVVHLLSNLLLVVDTCSTLKQTRVEIENVTWISLTT